MFMKRLTRSTNAAFGRNQRARHLSLSASHGGVARNGMPRRDTEKVTSSFRPLSTNGHSWLGSDNAILGGVGIRALDPFGPGERVTLGRGLVNQLVAIAIS
ncbi:hypothetical protein NE237_001880 [Protea cynaroides]|uniref:Uncharacterized protein n=1 Tax=Protea cynaroides TaxID=273540 RepID=A0A9Q0KUD3_9MAGN|nr:hypothetical protein NE237_001880 [Protea cynaroides]